MKSFKLIFGTFALLVGANSVAVWAAEEAADKSQGESVEKTNPKDPKAKVEPICGDIDE